MVFTLVILIFSLPPSKLCVGFLLFSLTSEYELLFYYLVFIYVVLHLILFIYIYYIKIKFDEAHGSLKEGKIQLRDARVSRKGSSSKDFDFTINNVDLAYL